jgi:hypothetical protein
VSSDASSLLSDSEDVLDAVGMKTRGHGDGHGQAEATATSTRRARLHSNGSDVFVSANGPLSPRTRSVIKRESDDFDDEVSFR